MHGGLCTLDPAGRLAAELLPFARAIAARTGDPGLQRLQPARWSRYWQGQLYEQLGSGAPPAWQQDQEESGMAAASAAAAAAGPGGVPPPAEDAIEESEDEDDW